MRKITIATHRIVTNSTSRAKALYFLLNDFMSAIGFISPVDPRLAKLNCNPLEEPGFTYIR